MYVHFVFFNAMYTSDEKIPMTDCAAYTTTNPGFEKTLASNKTTAETDYENPDAVS